MNYIGKLLGGLFGFMLGGPWTAVLGVFLGHLFDLKAAGQVHFGATNQKVQALFFKAVFACMGHLAKADGRITPSEISAARAIMQHLQLTEAQSKRAMELFYSGKDSDFDYIRLLHELKSASHGARNLHRMFMQLQFQAAYADGELSPAESDILLKMAGALGFSEFEYNQLHAMYRAQSAFRQGGFYRQQGQSQGQQQGRYNQNPFTHQNDLKNAYKTLGVNETDSKETIKKAYRKLISS